MSTPTDIAVRVGADIAPLRDNLRKGAKFTRNFGAKARRVAKDLDVMAGAAAAAGATITAAMVVTSANAAKELQNLSRISNTTNKRFQEIAYGAKQFGIEQDKLADIFKDTNDKLGDFLSGEGGELKDFFDVVAPKVGVTADQFRNLSGPQALQLYISSLEKANLTQAEMTFFMESIADEATALVPLFRDNGKLLAEQARHAQKLGIVLSDIEIQKLAQTSKEMNRAQALAGSFAKKFSAELAPAIQAVTKLLEDAAIEAGGVGAIATKAFDKMVKGAAFVMDAIDGIKRVFQITVDSVLIFTNQIAASVAAMVRDIIATINKIPGINFDEAEKSVAEFAANAQSVVNHAADNIHETLMAPMAGDLFKRTVDEMQTAANEAARVAAEAEANNRENNRPGGGPSVNIESSGDGQGDGKKEDLEAKLEKMREQFKSEEELRTELFAREREQLQMFRDQKLIDDKEFNEMRKELENKFLADLKNIRERGNKKLEQADEKSLAARAATLTDELGGMLTAFGMHSDKMQKVAAVSGAAKALISTFEGQAAALRLGWPMGPIAAAKIGAAGFGFVSKIKSLGGGAGGGGGGSAGSGVGGAAARGDIGQGQQVPQEQFNVNVQGLNPGQLFGPEQINQVFDHINERIRDGQVLGGITTS
nr:hypothetical protein 29 [bacterium]